jgi:predicted Zn-dependent protease
VRPRPEVEYFAQRASRVAVRVRGSGVMASNAVELCGYQVRVCGKVGRAVVAATGDWEVALRAAASSAGLASLPQCPAPPSLPPPPAPRLASRAAELARLSCRALGLPSAVRVLLRYEETHGCWEYGDDGGERHQVPYHDACLDLAVVTAEGCVMPLTWGQAAEEPSLEPVWRQLEDLRPWLDLAVGDLPHAAHRAPVMMCPDTAAAFVHEVFGHRLEAEAGAVAALLGRTVGPSALSLADDPTLPGLRGSYPFDHEGEPARRTPLIAHGVVVGYLHDRTTAQAHGVRTTGNARCPDFRFAPQARMSVLDITPGDVPCPELLHGGALCLRGMLGAKTDGDEFTLRPALAVWLERGRPAWRLPGVVIAGRCDEVNIEAVSRERLPVDGHQCVKGDPEPLAVSCLAPYFLVSRVEVDVQ